MMKEITLKIPEKKLEFFMELVDQLGFEISHPDVISEEDKAIVLERIKKSDKDPKRLLDWEKVRDDIKFH